MAQITKEQVIQVIEGQKITHKWKEGFLSTLDKSQVDYNKQDGVIEGLLTQVIPETDKEISQDGQLQLVQKRLVEVEAELDNWQTLLCKTKVTHLKEDNLNLPFLPIEQQDLAYDILSRQNTSVMQLRIILLIAKDPAFADNPLDSFDQNKVLELTNSQIAIKQSIKKLSAKVTEAETDVQDDEPQRLEPRAGLGSDQPELPVSNGQQPAHPIVECVADLSGIETTLTDYKIKVRDLIIETLSAQWGDDSDSNKTEPKVKSGRAKAYRVKKPKKVKADGNNAKTSVETTHALCQAQNLINDICDEYYGLVDELFEDSPLPPSNYHTFGTLIFDLFSFDGDSFSGYEKDSLLATRYTQAIEFKANLVASAAKLEGVKKTIEGKEASSSSSNDTLKGTNIRPVRVAIQGFLNVLWVQVQAIDDFLGVQLSSGGMAAFKANSAEGVDSLWSMYKRKLQDLANSISTDVSSVVDRLKPHWQRSAIANANKQARNFLDVVESYTHILIRAPKLIIDTKKARFELTRIVDRIDLGVSHELDRKLENREAVFSLIKGVANTSMEVAALAASASGMMVSGGRSYSAPKTKIDSSSDASGQVLSTSTSLTSASSSSTQVPLGKIDIKTDGILQGVENLCNLGAKQQLREVKIVVQQAYNSLSNDLSILQEMLECAQDAQASVLGKEERWLPQMDIERFEREGKDYMDFIAGVWSASGLLNSQDGASTPGKLERDQLRAKTNEIKALTELLNKPGAQISVLVSQ